jgi:molybdopterin-binding protein
LFDRDALLGSLQGGHAQTSEDAVEVSARNQLKGRVTGISLGGVMAEVRLDIGGQELVAVITRASVDRLRVGVGDEVLAVIKSTDVMIGKS